MFYSQNHSTKTRRRNPTNHQKWFLRWKAKTKIGFYECEGAKKKGQKPLIELQNGEGECKHRFNERC